MVNSMVERATSDMLIGPDWAMNIEICDMLNHDPGQAKDVVKGIKKRIGSRHSKAQLLALTLLETIIKNCGDIVHMHVAEKNVLHEMVRIVKKKPDFQVKEKILVLIDTWQEAFGGPRARYPQYYAAYQELLRAGAVFPQRSEQSAPVFTPPQTQPLASYPPNIRGMDGQPDTAETSAESEFPTLSLTEIQNAHGIMDVLAEMLNAIDPNNKEGLRQEVVVDLVEQCRTYKQRVVHLVNSTTDESLLCQGLALNDDLQRVLARHESFLSGLSTQNGNHLENSKPAPAGPLVDVDAPLVDTGDSGKQTDGRSSSGAEAGSQTLNQLMLPAPATSNGSAVPAKVDPKWDLLSGDTYDSPKADTSLALVPLGEQHAASPVSDQNALVLFDMFSNGDNASTPVNTQPTQQTNVAGQSGPFTPQFQQQQTFISQGGFYPNGSVPNAGSPQYEQSPLTQSTAPAWNGQIPNGSVPNSGSHQYEQSLHTQSTGPAWNGQVAEQQQPASPYGAQNSGSLPPPPWEAQPADNGSQLAGAQYPQPPQVSHMATTHVQSAANHQMPQAMGYGQAGGMYMQPNVNNHLSANNNHFGNNQLGMPPQHMQGGAVNYMGMASHQMQGGPAVSMYPQQMYGNQFVGYGYGQQQQQHGVPYIEQQMHGMSVRDDSYLRNSNQVSTSYVPSGKPSKPEDKLFGDLVNMAKVKPKPSPARAGSIFKMTNGSYATSENTVSTPPPTVSNEMPPPQTKKRKNRSEAWNHFIVSSEEEQKASCKYCDTKIKYNNGTSSMHAHLSRCLAYKKQKTSSCITSDEEQVGSPIIVKFDQEAIRRAMVKMFINMEIPFRKVEHESFHEFMSLASPRFQICSRTTLARDVLKLWDTERMILKNFLSMNCRRVCLTTDMWTSCQKLSYMCVTAHFIDNNWHLQKKILTFCQVTSHTGDAICETMEMCLNSWGLNRVLSLTVDNASSNDVGVERLKRRLLSKNSLVMSGNNFHMRCCAHILNLIVKEGLKDIDASVYRVRHAVWYARSSPARLAKFKACIDEESMDYKGLVSLDVETRWNSTYLMLVSASNHERTFEELGYRNKRYVNELTKKGKGVPTKDDWKHINLIIPFLKLFYDATVKISGSSYLTSNIYMFEVLGIGKSIVAMCASEDEHLRSAAQKMKKKYDKYWGSHDKLNMLLLIALVFDPRRKVRLVDWMVRRYYNKVDADALKGTLESCLTSIYEEYCVGFMCPQGNSNEPQVFGSVSHPYGTAEFYLSEGCDNADNELIAYLGEKLEHNMEINVLEWWRVNSGRYPILANIARDVLAIPISTVASESAFSTGERVLDPYRSSLTPKTVEALICTQDWLKGTSSSLITNEDFDLLERYEQELLRTEDGASCSTSSTSVALEEDFSV